MWGAGKSENISFHCFQNIVLIDCIGKTFHLKKFDFFALQILMFLHKWQLMKHFTWNEFPALQLNKALLCFRPAARCRFSEEHVPGPWPAGWVHASVLLPALRGEKSESVLRGCSQPQHPLPRCYLQVLIPRGENATRFSSLVLFTKHVSQSLRNAICDAEYRAFFLCPRIELYQNEISCSFEPVSIATVLYTCDVQA